MRVFSSCAPLLACRRSRSRTEGICLEPWSFPLPLLGRAFSRLWAVWCVWGPRGRSKTTAHGNQTTNSLVLLAQDAQGYLNLLGLVSDSFLHSGGEPPRVSLKRLEDCSTGLLALTGGADGVVGCRLQEKGMHAAQECLSRLAEAFPDRLYVEIQRHGLEAEKITENGFLALAHTLDLPLVASSSVFFAKDSDFAAHDALMCVATNRLLDDPDRPRSCRNYYFRSAEEMQELFSDIPEAVSNTLMVARRCHVFPEAGSKAHLPTFPTSDGRTEEEALRRHALAGLQLRLESVVWTQQHSQNERERLAQPYRRRLDYELSVIIKAGFHGYFLVVWDFVAFARRRGIPVGPGRGSGAGSVVAWALQITDLDPLRFGLLFERFLNPERVSLPDFDIDFCPERRDEVIGYVRDKYGSDRVAQITTFGKLQARAALRDIGRALGFRYKKINRICKRVPFNPQVPVTLDAVVEKEPELRDMMREDLQVERLFTLARGIEGLYRHVSTHAAGVVISDRPLKDLLPLYKDVRTDMLVTQFDMKSVADANLVKFDFLGLKTLTVIQRACAWIAQSGGADMDIGKIPLDDADVFALLGRGETLGVFQLESSGMRDVLRRLQADRFTDIVAAVALYRPGPMDNIPAYIARKRNREPVTYLHPLLTPILRETYGIMVYQEQVQQAARVVAGYSLGQADILRRAMGKKIPEVMEAERINFLRGAAQKDLDRIKAGQIFDHMARFAGYGFNKSHAAAYALLAYRTAWLKVHHPAQFLAANMSCDKSNTGRLALYREELQRLRIPLFPPSVQHSRADFAIERRKPQALGNDPGQSLTGAQNTTPTQGPVRRAGRRPLERPNGAYVTAFRHCAMWARLLPSRLWTCAEKSLFVPWRISLVALANRCTSAR